MFIIDGRTERGVRRSRELAARARKARGAAPAAGTWCGPVEALAGLRGGKRPRHAGGGDLTARGRPASALTASRRDAREGTNVTREHRN